MHNANENRYENMVYNYSGKSGLQFPAVSLGFWHNFSDIDDMSNARKIILHAFDKGITHFDLADNYGPPGGAAEKNFGRIFHKELSAYRDEIIISTKAGHPMWPGPYGNGGSRKHMLASLDQGLKRMNLEYVDIFYSHRYDPETDLVETMSSLVQAVRQGKAMYAGISNYPPDVAKKAFKILNSLGTDCVIHQVSYSMMNRQIERGLLDVHKKYNVGCIVFSPLAQGILTDKYLNGIPKDSRAAKDHGWLKREQVTDEKINKVKQLKEIAKERNQTIAQLSLSWALRDENIVSTLIGASRISHIDDNIGAIENLSFTPDELKRIDKILNFL